MQRPEKDPVRVAYERRNRDLDPQLAGAAGRAGLERFVVHAPPLSSGEGHPKVLIDDLLRDSRERAHEAGQLRPDLFADFNGSPSVEQDRVLPARPELARPHDSGGFAAGDGRASQSAKALRGKVQCIYLDPPMASNQQQLPVEHPAAT